MTTLTESARQVQPAEGKQQLLPRVGTGSALLAVVLTMAGGLGGALAGSATGAHNHHAETRLVVGEQTISAQSVPGYSLATQQLAENYARLIDGDNISARTTAAVSGAQVSIRASAIAGSSVLRIEATGSSASEAVAAAKAAAGSLRDVVAHDGANSDAMANIESRLSTAQEALARSQEAQRRAARAVAVPGPIADSASLVSKAVEAQAVAQVAQVKVNALAQAYQDKLRAQLSSASTITVESDSRQTGTDERADAEIGGLAGFVLVAVLYALVLWLRRRGEGH